MKKIILTIILLNAISLTKSGLAQDSPGHYKFSSTEENKRYAIEYLGRVDDYLYTFTGEIEQGREFGVGFTIDKFDLNMNLIESYDFIPKVSNKFFDPAKVFSIDGEVYMVYSIQVDRFKYRELYIKKLSNLKEEMSLENGIKISDSDNNHFFPGAKGPHHTEKNFFHSEPFQVVLSPNKKYLMVVALQETIEDEESEEISFPVKITVVNTSDFSIVANVKQTIWNHPNMIVNKMAVNNSGQFFLINNLNKNHKGEKNKILMGEPGETSMEVLEMGVNENVFANLSFENSNNGLFLNGLVGQGEMKKYFSQVYRAKFNETNNIFEEQVVADLQQEKLDQIFNKFFTKKKESGEVVFEWVIFHESVYDPKTGDRYQVVEIEHEIIYKTLNKIEDPFPYGGENHLLVLKYDAKNQLKFAEVISRSFDNHLMYEGNNKNFINFFYDDKFNLILELYDKDADKAVAILVQMQDEDVKATNIGFIQGEDYNNTNNYFIQDEKIYIEQVGWMKTRFVIFDPELME